MGVRLINRTTRSVSLTEVGALLLARLRPALTEITDAVEEVNNFRNTPMGTLKLNMPRSAAPLILGPVVARYLETYPGMRLHVSTDDRLIDIVAEGFDAGVRFGERIANDMVAVRITPPFRLSVAAAPVYFEGRSLPKTPKDLRDHSCIRYCFPSGQLYPWEFQKDGEHVEVDVDGKLMLDDQELMIEAALSGVGLAFTFEGRAKGHFESGRLIRVIEDWWPTFPGLYLYYSNRRQVPAGLRAFIDMMQARIDH